MKPQYDLNLGDLNLDLGLILIRIARTIWKATRCARNAACSASSATRTPPPSPRSACTPCSTAARRPPASSPSTARGFTRERRLGLVGDTFSRREVIERLPGNAAVGHVRYSTTGDTILRNVQPLFAELNAGGFAVGHNGNLTNGLTLRRELVRNGAMMQSTTDTEVILHLVAQSKRNRFIDRFIEALARHRGRLFAGVADQQEADRRARSARHPPAGAGRTRRLPDSGVGDLRARHHRRQIRPRHRARRSHRVRRARHPEPQAVSADAAAALHLRIHLFRAAGFDRRRPLGL